MQEQDFINAYCEICDSCFVICHSVNECPVLSKAWEKGELPEKPQPTGQLPLWDFD